MLKNTIAQNGIFCSSDVDLSDMRKLRRPSVKEEVLLEIALPFRDPLKIFHSWFEIARQECSFEEANAMCLATSTPDGRPSCRITLLKGYGECGFKFFSNYDSRKGRELEANPNASLTFFWPSIHRRQIRIEGKVEKLPVSEADEYWERRPYESQISAYISNQSAKIASRKDLENAKEKAENQFHGGSVPRPEHWGGYILKPDYFEFWQGQTNRLHDRIVFRRLQADENLDLSLSQHGENGWIIERLQP